MVRRLSLIPLVIAAAAVPVYGVDEVYPGVGVFAHVVDGAGMYTTLTLVNLDTLPAPYTLAFYGDDGSPLTLTTTAGTLAQISGTLNSGGSTIIRTNGGAPTASQGYAVLLSPVPPQQAFADMTGLYHYTIAGTAVFSLTYPNNPLTEATVPMDTGTEALFAFPFDHTTAVTGVAFANAYQSTTATVTMTAYDPSGAKLFSDTFQLPGYGHTSFLLTDKYPQLAGLQGVAIFSSTDSSLSTRVPLNVLGLRFNLINTAVSTVTPMNPCYYVSGTGCTN